MKKAALLPALLLLSICLLFQTCVKIKGEQKTGKQFTFTDSYGRELELNLPVQRIVSAAPSITECFFALGLEQYLVGRTDYCTYPPATEGIKSIGEIMEPSLETILLLEPDLVIASAHFKRKIVEALENAGIKTAVIKEEDSFSGLYRTLETIAYLTGNPEKSTDLVSDLKTEVKSIINRLNNPQRPRVYYVVGFGNWGDFTAGGDTFISELIEMAGGENIAKDVQGWSFNLESLTLRDPDLIICPDEGGMIESLQSSNGYKDLRAVKSGNVFPINRDLIELQGPRLVEGLARLAEIIHPEIFSGEAGK
jgi:iron complex transport system substrate-binding protein